MKGLGFGACRDDRARLRLRGIRRCHLLARCGFFSRAVRMVLGATQETASKLVGLHMPCQ